MKKKDIKTWSDATKHICKVDKKDFNTLVNESLHSTYENLSDKERTAINRVMETVKKENDIDGLGELGMLELFALATEYFERKETHGG